MVKPICRLTNLGHMCYFSNSVGLDLAAASPGPRSRPRCSMLGQAAGKRGFLRGNKRLPLIISCKNSKNSGADVGTESANA
jgi:hypothetical protein